MKIKCSLTFTIDIFQQIIYNNNIKNRLSDEEKEREEKVKRVFACLLVLALLMTSVTALAATSINGRTGAADDDLSKVTPFKFEHMKNGIGCGLCPVYSAPYQEAYRAADGKASVDTNSYIDVGGFNEQGWLLVRYSTNKGSTRVGWIPPKYVKDVKTSMYPHFSYIEQTAASEIYVTDNNLDPNDNSSYFAVLNPGETYYVVGRYNYYDYDFWYIEFMLDDQPARGFILVD